MEKVLFWKKWTDPDFDLYDDKNEHYTDWLNGPMGVARKCLDVIHPKVNYVKIDEWDTWDMNSTLSMIILPMLKQLNATKHGAPTTDDADVPEGLRSTDAPPKENEWDIDDNFFYRWDYVLEEMIWAFEQIIDDDDAEFEAHYHILPDGSKGEWMRDEFEEHNDRMQNGTILFGKYFRNLWW